MEAFCVKCQRETTKIFIRQSSTIKVFVQNILSDLRGKREFTHHNRLFNARGVAAHDDSQQDENNQSVLHILLWARLHVGVFVTVCTHYFMLFPVRCAFAHNHAGNHVRAGNVFIRLSARPFIHAKIQNNNDDNNKPLLWNAYSAVYM